FLKMAEALAVSGEREGLSPDFVRHALAQVLVGAGQLLAADSASAAERIAQIATPGGVTAEGLARLESAGLRQTTLSAFENSLAKCRSLTL
ncbi:MAG: pyrroline-5-carboxylate reductase dimerization domain-containing protein, partial [Bdellovibrionota bacterium]